MTGNNEVAPLGMLSPPKFLGGDRSINGKVDNSPSPRGGYGVFSPDQVPPVFFDSWDPKCVKKNWGAIPER